MNDKPIKIRLLVELELDLGSFDPADKDERAWLEEDILGAEPHSSGRLSLHSNELGDTVGTIKVLRIEGIL